MYLQRPQTKLQRKTKVVEQIFNSLRLFLIEKNIPGEEQHKKNKSGTKFSSLNYNDVKWIHLICIMWNIDIFSVNLKIFGREKE